MTLRLDKCPHCASPLAPWLTDRRMALLRLLADPAELTIEEVGQRLGLKRQTAKNQLFDLYHIMEVKGRTSAVLKAIECGILPSPRAP